MSGGVESPCVNVCTLGTTGRTCIGCFRTVDEIALWAQMSDAERAGVLALLPERRRRQELGDTGNPQTKG